MKLYLFLLAVFSLTPQMLSGIIVGTYNIRYDTGGDAAERNEWSRRAPVVAGLVRFHGFEVLCTQEALPHQMADLRRLLPDHDAVSYGRDDGAEKGEHMGVFFKKAMFTKVDSGRFWLSENPEKPGPGWDADLPRICTWAKLKRIEGGGEFTFFCVHLDHRGNNSRTESMKLLLERMPEIAGDSKVFLAGDFNTDQDSAAYGILASSGKVDDAAKVAGFAFIPNGTTNRFDPNSATQSRIDHIFVSKGVKVRRFGVLTDTYRVPKEIGAVGDHESKNFPKEVKFGDWKAHLPSDHFPVLIETVD